MSSLPIEFDELHAKIQVFVSPTCNIVVSDAASNAVAAGTLKTLKDFEKQIEAKRVAAVKPLNDEVKSINDYAKKITLPLAEAEALIKKKMGAYSDEERRKAEEERRQIEAKRQEEERKAAAERKAREDAARAQREAEERARVAAEKKQREELARRQKEEKEARRMFGLDSDEEAQQKADSEAAALKAKQEQERLAAQQKAEEARLAEDARLEREAQERENERRAELARIEANRPKNTRQVPNYKVVDPSKVPQTYWSIDDVRLGRDIRAGLRDVPGVEIWMETVVVTR
jgi:hypothetical protein